MDNHEEPIFSWGGNHLRNGRLALCQIHLQSISGKTCLIGLHPGLFLAWRLSQKCLDVYHPFLYVKQNWLFDHVNVLYIQDSSVNVINWDSSNIHKCAKLTPQGFPLSFLIGLGKIRKGLAISLHAKGGDILHFLPSWSRWSNLSDYWPFLLDLLIFQWAIHPKHSQIYFLMDTLIYS